MAAVVPDIDLIVGGHTHTFLYNASQQAGSGQSWPVLDLSTSATDGPPLGPYPTYVASSVQPGRSVPVLQVFWGSRWVAGFGG